MLPIDRIRQLIFTLGAHRWGRHILLSIMVGIASGLAAAGLEALLEFGSHHIIGRVTHLGGPQLFDFRWGILLLPAAGCLLSGLLILWLSPHNTEQGTDIYTRAFHHRRGELELKGPLAKAIGAACTIAFGGSAGPEGPIAGLGSALGSTIGRRFRLTPRERRTLLIAGCAGGVGAIFKCPLGGAIFAAEILYSEAEMETQSLMSAIVASVISYSTFMGVYGYSGAMLRGTYELAFLRPMELAPYAFLGLAAGITGRLFYALHHVIRRMVRRALLPRWLYPLAGGLLIGGIACAIPQVMDNQYRVIQNVLDGSFFTTSGMSHPWYWWGLLLLLIMLAKCIATVLTYGSGASGGILGPIVFIGGALGAAVGAFLESATPGLMTENLRMSLIPVGIAGVLSATMRVPLAAIVMVSEMTGSYGLLVPLMLVSVTGWLVSRGYGLNTEQLPSAVDSPAHAGDAMVSLLGNWRTGDIMTRDWREICTPTTTLQQIIAAIQPGTRPHFAVLKDGQLRGVISTDDVRAIMSLPALDNIIIAADFMTPPAAALHPSDDLYSVLQKFKEHGVDTLPVISEDGRKQFLSMLSCKEIHQAIRSRLLERQGQVMTEHTGIAAIAHDEQMHLLMSDFPATQGKPIHRCPVPVEVVGQSLRMCDFHKRYKLQVLAIMNADGSVQSPPNPDRLLCSDDTLVVIEDVTE